MFKIFCRISVLITAAMLTLGCKENSSGKSLPSSSGKPGEVAVVCSKAEWEGDPGSRLRDLLSSEVPYLPQAEPLYDLFNVPQQAFNKVFQVHRNIIVLDTDKKYSESSLTFYSNVWASPQLVISVTAATAEDAATLIAERGGKILATLRQTERSRVLQNIGEFENKELYASVEKMFGASPHFPSGYTVKKVADDFIWISYETTYTIQSILIWKYPYSEPADFTPEALAAKRNEMTRKHIPCTREGSYMMLNPDIFPGYDNIKINGRDVLEMRGLWEAYNDFMGGPFVSHTFLSEDGGEIITLDGFVYAPKYDKRNYVRQVEAILYSYE